MIIRTLFNHHGDAVGKAYLHKKNSKVSTKFDPDKIHYGNEKVDFEDYKKYKENLGLRDDSDMPSQLELF